MNPDPIEELTELTRLRATVQRLTDALRESEKAIQHFVDKVESGKARSIESYGLFKSTLTHIATALAEEGSNE